MMRLLTLILLFHFSASEAATIAIIDTGFDLDHGYLSPNILKNKTDEEIDFNGWDFFDNTHMKRAVIEDETSVQEILLFRSLKAKGYNKGLSEEEFIWFTKKSADKTFMEKVKRFKKHSHGTFVAGIALREGENINILPIRGLIPNTVISINEEKAEKEKPLKSTTPEERFQEEITNSIDRVTKKFSKICRFIASKKIQVVNASYGITYKSILNKFRERHLEIVGKEIEEVRLKILIDDYFRVLYERGEKTMKRYPKILFVFSAGNSGLNNDRYHHYPSKIKLPNTISVAAMNGEHLATFSNFGEAHVDIGAPGVAIMAIVPKIYSDQDEILYSPSSGTSMAAPYVANLAAQILNANPKLTPVEIKRIIMETGEVKKHLKTRLASGSIASNNKAIRAALLSPDLPLEQAITLGRSGLIPIEDKVSFGIPQGVAPAELKKDIMNSIPTPISPQDLDETTTLPEPTIELSSSPKDPEIEQPDNSKPLLSRPEDPSPKSVDQVPSNQKIEQSPKPSEDLPASSSEPEPSHQEIQSQASLPSSLQ